MRRSREKNIHAVQDWIDQNKETFVCFGPLSVNKTYKCTNCEKRTTQKKNPPRYLYAHFKSTRYDYDLNKCIFTKNKTNASEVGVFCSPECENMFILAIS